MSKGAFRNVVDVDSGGGVAVSTPNSSVFVNGNRVMVIGSQVGPHPSAEAGGALIEGSSTVTAEGIGVCRKGDATTCGHTANVVSPDVFIGD